MDGHEFQQWLKGEGIASHKVVKADPTCSFCVLTLGEASQDLSEEDHARIMEKVENFTGMDCVVLPPGSTMRILPDGGVYLRESLDTYEYEIVAKNDADLRRMAADIGHPLEESKKLWLEKNKK